VFWKLTEWCRFVTYLWNDPRILSKVYGVMAVACCFNQLWFYIDFITHTSSFKSFNVILSDFKYNTLHV